jgi:hypothetical protein
MTGAYTPDHCPRCISLRRYVLARIVERWAGA